MLRRLAEHWTSILKNPKLKTGIGQTTRIALMSKLKQIREFFDWVTKNSTPALCFPIEIEEMNGKLVFKDTSVESLLDVEVSRMMPMNVDRQTIHDPKKISRRVNATPTGTQNLVRSFFIIIFCCC